MTYKRDLQKAQEEIERLKFRLNWPEKEFGAVWNEDTEEYEYPGYNNEDWNLDHEGEEEEEEG